jgi:hypothetical protein
MENLTNAVSKRVYCDYPSGNYGVHALSFTDPKGNEFYYSYDTLVAFRSSKTGLVCLKNYWSTTTGKHLNTIQPDHKARVDQATFDKLYKEAFTD